MKLVILSLLISLSANAQLRPIPKYPQHTLDSLNALEWGIDHKPTKYEPGYIYRDNWGHQCILIDYLPVDADPFGIWEFRWIVGVDYDENIEKPLTLEYTDDLWIDKGEDQTVIQTEHYKNMMKRWAIKRKKLLGIK